MNHQKENIITTSWEMFFQFGIKSVSMDDIASKMGISKKTLYQYFANKKELIEEACKYDIANPKFSFQSASLQKLNAIDQYLEFFEFVNQMISLRCDSLDYDLKKYYPEIWESFKNKKIELFYKEITINLKQGVKEQLFRSDITIEYIAKNLVSFYLNLASMEYRVFNDHEIFNTNMHRELTIYHLHGICTQKGIDYFVNKFK